MWSACTKIALIEKKYFEKKNEQTGFCCLFVNPLTVKIWKQSDKFPLNFFTKFEENAYLKVYGNLTKSYVALHFYLEFLNVLAELGR